MENGCVFTLLWLQHENFLKGEQTSNGQNWFCHLHLRYLQASGIMYMDDSLGSRACRKGLATFESFSFPCLKQMVCFFFAPFQIAFVMFAVYTLVDNTHILDAQKAFVSLTLINILNTAHSFLPFSINAVVQVNCRICFFFFFFFGQNCFLYTTIER